MTEYRHEHDTMKRERTLSIHTDGGARGNPGPGAIGVTIEEDGQIIDAFGRMVGERVTNNQAEYLAVEAALQRAMVLGADRIELTLDSELVASQLRQEFRVKDRELSRLFVRVWNLLQGFRKVTIRSVPRAQNQAADEQVNRALDAAGY